MALSRPALDILGISPNFARLHHQAIVVAVADAIYRAAIGRYHPDKGDDAVSVPNGVDLTELQAARDAVRENPTACIKEIRRGERTSKEGRRSEELASRVSHLEEADDAWTESTEALWDYIAREKLGLNIDEEMMDKRVVAYSTLNLNGVAILVAADERGKSVSYEYLRHNSAWFKRPVVKVQYSKKSPCPPDIPLELIVKSSAVGSEQGNFYDQSGPHMMSEGFEVLGSYRKADLARARLKKRRVGGKKTEGDASEAVRREGLLNTGTMILDPLVVSVLKPSVSIGAVLQTAMRGTGKHVQYSESGVIVGIRVFDQKQRP